VVIEAPSISPEGGVKLRMIFWVKNKSLKKIK